MDLFFLLYEVILHGGLFKIPEMSSTVVLEQPSVTVFYLSASQIKFRDVKRGLDKATSSPPCHCKVIIQTCWLCVHGRGSLLLFCHVCLHPLFPQAFWGHGSFSLGDQVNHGEVREAGQSHRRPLQAESRETGGASDDERINHTSNFPF